MNSLYEDSVRRSETDYTGMWVWICMCVYWVGTWVGICVGGHVCICGWVYGWLIH